MTSSADDIRAMGDQDKLCNLLEKQRLPFNSTTRHHLAPGRIWKRVKGVEPDPFPRISSENPHISEPGAPKASPAFSPPVPADADLAAVVEAWADLPEPIKAGILAMVKAARIP